MGLISDAKRYRRMVEFKETFFELFGMTVEDAKEILKSKSKPVEVSQPKISEETVKEIKKAVEENKKKYMTPEQIVEQFAGSVEEFYPNGRPEQAKQNA